MVETSTSSVDELSAALRPAVAASIALHADDRPGFIGMHLLAKSGALPELRSQRDNSLRRSPQRREAELHGASLWRVGEVESSRAPPAPPYPQRNP